MKTILSSETMDIPEGESIKVHAKLVEVEGPREKLVRDFKHLNLDFHLITDENGKRKLKVEAWFGSRKTSAVIRTALSHVDNLITGVTGSGLDGVGRSTASRRSDGAKVFEPDGEPLAETEALHGMIRLFRITQPLYRGQLQRLLSNLCAHSETRTSLVKVLMDLLILDVRKLSSRCSTVETPYRLHGRQSNVMYSCSQSFDGVPPAVSARTGDSYLSCS